jgi:hypothetical protein
VIGVRIPGTALMEGEPARGRAPLLADARVTPCRSSRPSSSEDEPARSAGPGRKPGGRQQRGDSNSPSSAISRLFTPGGGADPAEREPAGWRAPPRKRLAARAVGLGTSSFLDGRCAAGAATGLESPCGLSRLEDRHFHLPLAATQPVDGAVLIRRYRSVRLRGGQLGRIPSAL